MNCLGSDLALMYAFVKLDNGNVLSYPKGVLVSCVVEGIPSATQLRQFSIVAVGRYRLQENRARSLRIIRVNTDLRKGIMFYLTKTRDPSEGHVPYEDIYPTCS